MQLVEENPQGSIKAAGSLFFSPWNPRAVRRVAAVANSFQPDVAHLHNTWFAMSPAVILSLKRLDIPTVLTLHNYRITCANGLLFRDGGPCEMCVGSHPWHAVKFACYRGSRTQSLFAAATIEVHRRLGSWTEHVNTFIALSEAQRELMIRAGLPSSKLRVKPNFVADPGARVRPPSASKQVVYVGRLSEEKGVQVLLDAWEQVDMPHLELLIVGDGPERSALEARQPPRTRFTGPLRSSEVRSLMLSARALVVPSLWYETMGLVVLEAFSSRLPVIASDVGAPGDIVRKALGPKWIFRAGSVGSLKAALETIASDSWCDAAAAHARRVFEATFSESQAATRLVEIYQPLVARVQEPEHSPPEIEVPPGHGRGAQ